MREMHQITSVMVGMGLDEHCGLVTDGRFPGPRAGRASATCPRRRRRGAPWPWFGTATSSNTTFRTGAWTSWCRRTSWRGGARPGSRASGTEGDPGPLRKSGPVCVQGRVLRDTIGE